MEESARALVLGLWRGLGLGIAPYGRRRGVPSILMLAPAIHEPGLAEISTAPLIASSSSMRAITCVHGTRPAARVGWCPRVWER